MDDMGRLVEMLGCKMESLSFTYLGLLVGAPFKCKKMCMAELLGHGDYTKVEVLA